MFRINDRVSIRKGEGSYSFTIEHHEVGYVKIIDCCNILRKELRETLDEMELMGGYFSPYTGILFLNTKEEAEKVSEYLDEQLKSKRK